MMAFELHTRGTAGRFEGSAPAKFASAIRRSVVFCAILLVAGTAAAAASSPPRDRKAEIPVFVSILPQAYFVERIGGEHVEVDVLVGPGKSPATYQPTPRQMARLSEASLFFRIGVPFEDHLVDKISAAVSGLRIVDVPWDLPESVVHSEHSRSGAAEYGSHGHRDGDPHIWLDPNLVRILAESICFELSCIDSANRGNYEANLRAFASDLDSVDALISKRLAPFAGRELYVFHPAFGHFAKAYGLKQVAIEHEGKEPSAKQLAEWIERTESENVKVVVVQKQFSIREAEAIAESIDAAILPLDPLAKDYLDNLVEIAEALVNALGTAASQLGEEGK